jgi:hypothetical protein
MTSLVSGVAEEAGFRGYMQGPIEAERGPVAAIAIAGAMFWLAHLTSYSGHPGMFLGRIWFYLAASMIFGTLAHLTDSILPAVAAHSVQNALAFGLLWWSSRDQAAAGDHTPLAATLVGLVLVTAAVGAYRRLASITAAARESKTRND